MTQLEAPGCKNIQFIGEALSMRRCQSAAAARQHQSAKIKASRPPRSKGHAGDERYLATRRADWQQTYDQDDGNAASVSKRGRADSR